MKSDSHQIVRIIHGNRQCRALLLDFSSRDCSVLITDQLFSNWNIGTFSDQISVALHGETRLASLIRLERRTGVLSGWILSMELR